MGDALSEEGSYYTYYDPPKTFVKSALRVISVLEYFYRTRQPARAIEISRELELPVSSTKYLLASCVESGYLIFDKSSKTYFPSILLTGLASWLSEIYPNVRVLRDIAREAQQTHGGTASIAVQHDEYMRTLVIETEAAGTPASYDFHVRIPLTGSASGSIALAVKTDIELNRFAMQEARKLPPERRKDHGEEVLNQIRLVRQQGFAAKEHHLATAGSPESYIAVAVALPREGKPPPMALGVCGLKEQLAGREADIAKSLQKIVQKYRIALQS